MVKVSILIKACKGLKQVDEDATSTQLKVYLAPKFEPNKTGKDNGGRKLGKSSLASGLDDPTFNAKFEGDANPGDFIVIKIVTDTGFNCGYVSIPVSCIPTPATSSFEQVFRFKIARGNGFLFAVLTLDGTLGEDFYSVEGGWNYPSPVDGNKGREAAFDALIVPTFTGSPEIIKAQWIEDKMKEFKFPMDKDTESLRVFFVENSQYDSAMSLFQSKWWKNKVTATFPMGDEKSWRHTLVEEADSMFGTSVAIDGTDSCASWMVLRIKSNTFAVFEYSTTDVRSTLAGPMRLWLPVGMARFFARKSNEDII